MINYQEEVMNLLLDRWISELDLDCIHDFTPFLICTNLTVIFQLSPSQPDTLSSTVGAKGYIQMCALVNLTHPNVLIYTYMGS